MFQSPLYYIISAFFLRIFQAFFNSDLSILLLKLIPLLSGIIQIEIAYRCLLLVFPHNLRLQMIGLVFVAFIPMNIYMSLYIGNEPLYALLGSIFLSWLFCFYISVIEF